MMNKEKFLVYDPKTDTLNLNDSEHQLIDLLSKSPEIKYRRIISEYLSAATNRVELFIRLDEITSFYYTKIKYSSDVIVPFLTYPEGLLKLIEVLEELRDEILKNPTDLSNTAEPRKFLTARQYAIVHHYLQDSGEQPLFENSGMTKKACIQNLVKKYLIILDGKPTPVSMQSFTEKYNLIHQDVKERTRVYEDLQAALDYLPDNSKAKNLLLDEIKITFHRESTPPI